MEGADCTSIPGAMSWLRQGRHFVLIGILQWLADWSVMVALSHAGLAIAYSNIAGRIGGALLGFWLNGRITFSRDGSRPGSKQLVRYMVLWCSTATLSTLAVMLVDACCGLHGAWLGKPLIDTVLAIGSFLASRYWVYN
jgi:putative flippase GtrA